MGFFDQAYDEMTMGEVICRLPGELALKSLKKRLSDLDTVHEFITSAPNSLSKVSEINYHINDILKGEDVGDILEKFESESHPILFQWMSSDNSKRVSDDAGAELDIKFAFNLTKSDDLDGMTGILDRILAESSPEASQVQSVLEKSKGDVFLSLANTVLRDSRELVRAVPICLSYVNRSKLSDHQQVVSLKAYASAMPGRKINVLGFDLFTNLRAGERYGVLSAYLDQFPTHRKLQCFNPMPTDTEFDFLLFAGSIDDNERMQSIKDRFIAITQLDPEVSVEDE